MTPTPTLLTETSCDCAVGVTCDTACQPLPEPLPAPMLDGCGVVLLVAMLVVVAWGHV